MIGRVALSSVCAGLALYIAVQADDEAVQATAALTSSCLIGFSVTSVVLERQRERKSREANADVYLEMLRQINTPRPLPSQQPKVCEGCCHYHGRMYGGNLLVCAMHPYGVEDDRCPDWESKEADNTDLNVR
ncbi:MAG: hypothetical protein Kow00121_63370 [Elainellaceae cyanobacterium]